MTLWKQGVIGEVEASIKISLGGQVSMRSKIKRQGPAYAKAALLHLFSPKQCMFGISWPDPGLSETGIQIWRALLKGEKTHVQLANTLFRTIPAFINVYSVRFSLWQLYHGKPSNAYFVRRRTERGLSFLKSIFLRAELVPPSVDRARKEYEITWTEKVIKGNPNFDTMVSQICGNLGGMGPTPNITAELSRLKKKRYPFGFASTST